MQFLRGGNTEYTDSFALANGPPITVEKATQMSFLFSLKRKSVDVAFIPA